MFRNLRTGTKLLILCGAFILSIVMTVYGLVTEKRIAIEFARKELVGSRYLGAVRNTYANLLAVPEGSAMSAPPIHRDDVVFKQLSDLAAGADGHFDTHEFAGALMSTLRELERRRAAGGNADELVSKALAEAQSLAQRIGDDSNLTLDPDLDSYYVQNIVVRSMPSLLGRFSELQQFFEASIEKDASSVMRQVRLPILASQVASTAREVKADLQAAYRGNSDGSLKQAVDAGFGAMFVSIDSYLGALSTSTSGIDTRDAVTYNRFQVSAVQHGLKAWSLAQFELDRLLRKRIDGLLGRMQWGLALIGGLAGLSIILAILTHRHIVGPLRRLETVALAVREHKDYSLRATHSGLDEIGRVTSGFNEMLAELAAARRREIAARSEAARVARLTSMGEMAASIAHEINQPLFAIVTNANAGLRWLGAAPPDLGRLETVLKRVVRDGHRASDVIASVRALIKQDAPARAPLSIEALIEDIRGLVREDLQREQISLQVQLAYGLPSVQADRTQLQQVLLNLISNAVDAMRETQDRPRELQISAAIAEPEGVVIAVADSGEGLDANADDRIFEAFFTTKDKGMGLGLSICRSIIEAHGGRLWASRGNPNGSIFQFTLPCKGDA